MHQSTRAPRYRSDPVTCREYASYRVVRTIISVTLTFHSFRSALRTEEMRRARATPDETIYNGRDATRRERRADLERWQVARADDSVLHAVRRRRRRVRLIRTRRIKSFARRDAMWR